MKKAVKRLPDNVYGPRRSAGFTLIELAIVVAIIGIISTVGFQSYGEYIEKQRRGDARALLMINSSRLTRCLTFGGSYANCRLDQTSEEGHYTLNTDIDTFTWQLTAVPAAGSPQVSDEDCVSFQLNHVGLKTATGAAPNECW